MRQKLVLKDGSIFFGFGFGYPISLSGEVVFNTGMVGYPETLTDPSYKNQILVFTYPLIGNYGIPPVEKIAALSRYLESEKIHLKGVVLSDVTEEYSHWNGVRSLSEWLNAQKIAAVSGIDTRALTKKLRERGTMPGKIVLENEYIEFCDPSKDRPVPEVSVKEPMFYEGGQKRVALIDCGCKLNIIRSLLKLNISVLRVPWNYTDLHKERFDGIVVSNGPGDPKKCGPTIEIIRKSLEGNLPVFGICLGNQILGLAAGADTFKLKFGHRSQNQPRIKVGTKRCYITSQNHGYAIDSKTIPPDWEPWFFNANDGTNEGIRHRSKPFRSVQFHPEASPGPEDTNFLFEEFVKLL
ncbi:MAG: glutamine-hydrolyzing carbamoyl-phosphate synthase small subunit [Nitrospinota bacterium]